MGQRTGQCSTKSCAARPPEGMRVRVEPFSPLEYLSVFTAGWSSLVARRAHNPKVAGSNPAPATLKHAAFGRRLYVHPFGIEGVVDVQDRCAAGPRMDDGGHVV